MYSVSTMLNSICKNLLQLNSKVSTKIYLSCFLQNPIARTITHTSQEPTNQQSLAISYLIDSCGLPPQAALSASKKIRLKTFEKPDSILEFLSNHGFTKPQITSLVTKFPLLLSAKIEKTLKPKIEFFHGLGYSGPNLARILASHPFILRLSLENQIIPYFCFLRSILHTNENVVTAFNRLPSLIYQNLPKTVARNVEILRDCGVPEPRIAKLLMMGSKAFKRDPDQFAVLVAEVKEMGIGPLEKMFIYALRVRSAMGKSTWEKKVAIYKSLGCSEDEFLLGFRKLPTCMLASEEKIGRGMDFFMNKVKMRPAEVLTYPMALLLSLEKTIAPRCSVLNILMLKGIIKRDIHVLSALNLSKARFFDTFVAKYQEEVSDVLKAYQGKISFIGFEIGCEDVRGSQNL